MAQKREFFRIAIDRAGQVHRGSETVLCHVVNLTEKGFQLRVEGPMAVGDTLHVEFALSEASVLMCTVRATYVEPPLVGVVISNISPENKRKLTRFIDEMNTLTIAGF